MRYNEDILIYDNFLPTDLHHAIYQHALKQDYQYTYADENDTDPKTMDRCFEYNGGESDSYIDLIIKAAKMHKDMKFILDQSEMYRGFYNLYLPGCRTTFHKDSKYEGDEGWTFLYFPNIEPWDNNKGGELQIIKEEIIGIRAVPNRIVAFNGVLWHKGNCYTNNDIRRSVAIQTHTLNGKPIRFDQQNKPQQRISRITRMQ